MTSTTSSGPDAGPPSLARWLAGRRDSDLAALLRARPDLVVPPPATMAVLANRAQQRASVFRAADELTTGDFGVIEALARLGAAETPVTRRALLDLLSGRTTAKNVDRTLDRLRTLLLVWGPADRLSLVPAATETVPWRIARSTASDLPDDAALATMIDDLDAARRGILDTLARTSPVGRTKDAAADAPADRPVQQLIASGLLIRLDDETVELPHRVGQHLRGEAPFDPAALVPPAPIPATHTVADVNATAAGAALELLRHAEELIDALGSVPAPALKSGGLGVRELRRLAKTVGIDETHAALLVEVLAAAGLIARGLPDPPPPTDVDDYWAPTTSADGWSKATTGHRWAVLAGAWLDSPRRPWLVGRRDQNDKPIAALSEEVQSPPAVRDRRLLLELLAETPGSSPDAGQARAALAWRRPRWAGRLGSDAVAETLREATALAVVAHGSIASPGKALLHGGDAEAEMAAVLPQPVDYVLVQADLTVVAPGPLVPDLAARVALVADVESAGAATVYRIGEASVRRALDAGAGAGVDHVVAEALVQFSGRLLGLRIVPGDRQRAAVGGAGGPRVGHQVAFEDGVEGLDHAGALQVLRQQFAGGGRLAVQLGELAVALRVVVVGVQHDLAGEGLGRQLAVAAEGDRQQQQVAEAGGLLHAADPAAQGDHGAGQCVRATGVAEHHLVAVLHAQFCQGAADEARPDDSDTHRLSPVVHSRWGAAGACQPTRKPGCYLKPGGGKIGLRFQVMKPLVLNREF